MFNGTVSLEFIIKIIIIYSDEGLDVDFQFIFHFSQYYQ